MNYLLMAIEVEGKIFSTGNNPSLQRIWWTWMLCVFFFLSEGGGGTTTTPALQTEEKKKNVFDLIDWNSLFSFSNRTVFFLLLLPLFHLIIHFFFFFFLLTWEKKLTHTAGMGRRIYQSNLRLFFFFWSKILGRILFIDNTDWGLYICT